MGHRTLTMAQQDRQHTLKHQRTVTNQKTNVKLNMMKQLCILALLVTCLSCSPRAHASDNAPTTSDSSQHQDGGGAAGPAEAQRRAGGLEASDYADEASEIDVMANQQQIPTAQLMSAAGHIVPDNFFLPGGSVPAAFYAPAPASRYASPAHMLAAAHFAQQQAAAAEQQHQQQQQQQQHNIKARHAALNLAANGGSQSRLKHAADLLAAAAEQHEVHAIAPPPSSSPPQAAGLDYAGYNQPNGNENQAAAAAAAAELELLNFAASQSLLAEHQQQVAAEQQLAAELAHHHHHHHQHHLHHPSTHGQQHAHAHAQYARGQPEPGALAQASETDYSAVGPAYSIAGSNEIAGYDAPPKEAASNYNQQQQQQQQQQHQQQNQRPFGLPTKSSSKEPSGMLKPLGNPKTVSSPVIDFVANRLPKDSQLEKLAERLPNKPAPTVFSFSSSRDPYDQVLKIRKKERNAFRQAEQMARGVIRAFNDKFGTNLGDQTDIPFILSSISPLGLAQNLLFDPTLALTLLNSAEKTYFSDVLPAPAKMAIRPILNVFRVPNKKRGDKANLSNIISFLASGGQTPPSSSAPKHRPGTGVEKVSKVKQAR